MAEVRDPKLGVALTSISHPVRKRSLWRVFTMWLRERTWGIRGVVVSRKIDIDG